MSRPGHNLSSALPERTETGLITASYQAVRAVHSCNMNMILVYNSAMLISAGKPQG